jgi:hypothetical protein
MGAYISEMAYLSRHQSCFFTCDGGAGRGSACSFFCLLDAHEAAFASVDALILQLATPNAQHPKAIAAA